MSSVCVCVYQSDVPEESASGPEPTSLLGRLPLLFRRMRKMCVQLVKKSSMPDLSEDLDQFTGKTRDVAINPTNDFFMVLVLFRMSTHIKHLVLVVFLNL